MIENKRVCFDKTYPFHVSHYNTPMSQASTKLNKCRLYYFSLFNKLVLLPGKYTAKPQKARKLLLKHGESRLPTWFFIGLYKPITKEIPTILID